MSAEDWKSHTPLALAKDKEAEGMKRFENPGIRPEFVRQSDIIFSNVPPELLLGFALNANVNLWEWINRPFDTPPETLPDQLELFALDSISAAQIVPSQT